jgi:hypothetical protein
MEMYRTLASLFTLPILVLLLLVGIIDSALAAPPPAMAAATPAGFTLAPAPAMPCCSGSGGPYEPVAETRQDVSNGARWRVSSDPRLERRLAPAPWRPLNTITIRF